MHRLICFCYFLVWFQAFTSSEQTSNVTGNRTTNPRALKPDPTVKGERPPSESTNSKFPFSIECPAKKSCKGRCTLNREFHKPKEDLENCFCDPWCDSVFHDCCSDYDEQCNASFMKENSPKNELDDLWTCTKINKYKLPIWTIGKCKPTWKNEKIAKKCTTPNDSEISTLIPVIDENNVTFQNRYCAICNEINIFEPWNFTVKCSAEPPSRYTEAESWQFTDYFCQKEFLKREFPTRGRRYCYNVIKTCKKKSTDRYKKNCAERPVGLVAKQNGYKNYKNSDCFSCNFGYKAISNCGPSLQGSAGKISNPRPYSAIFSISTKNSFTSYSRCPTAQIYNARLGRCNELFEGNIMQKSQQLLQKFAVVLKYDANKSRMCTSARDMEMRFGYVFERLLKVSLIDLNLEFGDLGIHKQNDSSFIVTFQLLGLKQDIGNSKGVPLEYSKIEKLIFHASFTNGMGNGICRYFLTKRVAREMTCVQNVTFIAANISTEFPNGTLRVSLNQTTHTYYNKGEFLQYNETFLAICKDVKPSNCSYYDVVQNSSDFILFPNRSIYSHVANSVFNYGEYSIIETKIWLCLNNDHVWRANRIHVPLTSIHTTILSYVTLVSLTISVLSLCTVMIVYSLNKSLRNLPGKNLMLLCGTLALAQTLWLIERNMSTLSALCTTATIASHFAFLSSFCTSGSIALHSYLTFRRVANGKLYDASNTREFLWYCAYGTGLPALWVSICWTLDTYQVISLRNETSDTCWLGNSEGLRIAFLYPAALQLFVNITLLMETLRHIQKCSKASQQLQKKNGATKQRHVGIYLRMSTLMGLSWLFGAFVAIFPRVVAFEYLFAFGNGFQGLYIALAFLLTKNVKKIMTKRLTHSTGRSHASPTSEKTKE